jgi:hypothetical protein
VYQRKWQWKVLARNAKSLCCVGRYGADLAPLKEDLSEAGSIRAGLTCGGVSPAQLR